MDVLISASAILFLLPLLLPLGLAMQIDSPGPIFFSQLRWGKDGRKIKIYKLRTMFAGHGDTSGVTQTVRHDPRITPLGRFLRRSNIDELPQLWNVLKGDMSLIGPRCHPIGMTAAGRPYEELVPNYHRRHRVRPGMTGLAQMRGLRGPTVSAARARQRIAADLYYVEHFTIWLDLKILVGTLKYECLRGSGF